MKKKILITRCSVHVHHYSHTKQAQNFSLNIYKKKIILTLNMNFTFFVNFFNLYLIKSRLALFPNLCRNFISLNYYLLINILTDPIKKIVCFTNRVYICKEGKFFHYLFFISGNKIIKICENLNIFILIY